MDAIYELMKTYLISYLQKRLVRQIEKLEEKLEKKRQGLISQDNEPWDEM